MKNEECLSDDRVRLVIIGAISHGVPRLLSAEAAKECTQKSQKLYTH